MEQRFGENRPSAPCIAERFGQPRYPCSGVFLFDDGAS